MNSKISFILSKCTKGDSVRLGLFELEHGISFIFLSILSIPDGSSYNSELVYLTDLFSDIVLYIRIKEDTSVNTLTSLFCEIICFLTNASIISS